MFTISKQALQGAIARLVQRERESAGDFDPAEIAAGAASQGFSNPQEYADSLVRLNQNVVDYRKTLQAVLEAAPNATEFQVPNEAEFLAGKEIVEAADELRTRFDAEQYVQ